TTTGAGAGAGTGLRASTGAASGTGRGAGARRAAPKSYISAARSSSERGLWLVMLCSSRHAAALPEFDEDQHHPGSAERRHGAAEQHQLLAPARPLEGAHHLADRAHHLEPGDLDEAVG